METHEFKTYFSKVPHLLNYFIGTFALDQIPHDIPRKHFLVLNLDPSFLKGSHWIAIIRLQTKEIEIFDSLSLNIEKLLPALKFKKKFKLIYNTVPVQSKESKLCGKFVIMFLVERMKNQCMEFEDLLESIFSDNLIYNDVIVNNFCDHLD